MPGPSGKWFHTLVVVGASMSACGGKLTHEVGADSGTAAGTGTGGAAAGTDVGKTAGNGSGGAAAGGAQGGAASSAGSGGVVQGGGGGAARPSPDDCKSDGQFMCDDFETLSNCRCDLMAPSWATECPSPLDYRCTTLPCSAAPGKICVGERYVGCHCDPSGLRPEDCAAPEQFYCANRQPYFSDCHCREDLPTDATACPSEYCCQSTSPRFGCGCFCAMIK